MSLATKKSPVPRFTLEPLPVAEDLRDLEAELNRLAARKEARPGWAEARAEELRPCTAWRSKRR